METYGRNASGETSMGIEYKVIEDGDVTRLQILGASHLFELEDGRGPTTQGGSGVVREKIKDWIRAKGITSNLTEDSLAFLISRKIHREGYKGTKGVLSDVFSEERINAIGNSIAELQTMEIALFIDDNIKKENKIMIYG
jgi:hypothetical protein